MSVLVSFFWFSFCCVSWFSKVVCFYHSFSSLSVPGQFFTDDAGRFVLCEFRFHGKLFRVVSLYAPNRNPARDQFLELVPSWVDPAIPTVVCGDFNTVFDRSLDRAGSVASDTSRESSSTLSWLFDECCVVDAWRYLHPSSSGYTWMSPDGSVSSLY